MRANDFLGCDYIKIPTEPIDMLHETALRQMLLDDPQLFESSGNYAAFKNFLELHSTQPVLGKSYVYTSIHSLLPAQYITISHFDKPHKLIKLENNRGYFSINGQVKPYPDYNDQMEDLLKSTLFFNTISEYEEFYLLLKLKFSDWRVKPIVISTDIRENFADGKGPGKPGDSRRHGIPKHATLAQLDKIGQGSGRRAQLARWQANMRRGRKK